MSRTRPRKRISAVIVWIPVIAWAGMIFLFSSFTHDVLGILGIKIVRKAGHVVEYFVFAFLVYVVAQRKLRKSPGTAATLAGIVPFLYALTDEFHQSFVPTRICCISDIFIDMIGVLAFFVLVDYIASRRDPFSGRRSVFFR